MRLTKASETAFPGFTICSSITNRFKKNLTFLEDYGVQPDDIIHFDNLWKTNNSKLIHMLEEGNMMDLYNALTPSIE